MRAEYDVALLQAVFSQEGLGVRPLVEVRRVKLAAATRGGSGPSPLPPRARPVSLVFYGVSHLCRCVWVLRMVCV